MADIILCDTPSLVFGVHAKDWREVNYVVGISLSKQEYTFQLFVSVLVTNLVLYPIITWCFITLLRYFMFVDSFPIVTSVITPKKHGQGQACHESRNKDTNALGAHKKQTIFFIIDVSYMTARKLFLPNYRLKTQIVLIIVKIQINSHYIITDVFMYGTQYIHGDLQFDQLKKMHFNLLMFPQSSL